MKRCFNFILLIVLLLSCSPKDVKDGPQTNDHTDEIDRLTEEVNKLKKKLDEDKKQEDETGQSKTRMEELEENIRKLNQKLLQLDSKLELKMSESEEKYQNIIEKISEIKNTTQQDNNYITTTELESTKRQLEKDIEENILAKIARSEYQNDPNIIAELKSEISQLKEKLTKLENHYLDDLNLVFEEWKSSFIELIQQNSDQSKKQIYEMVSKEVSRINTNIENLNLKYNHLVQIESTLKLQIDQLQEQIAKQDTSENESLNFKLAQIKTSLAEIQSKQEQFQKEIDINKQSLASIEKMTSTLEQNTLVYDITEKFYSPCKNGLKDQPYCYTFGTMITKLGGQFIDPMGFAREEKDFLKYMRLSGVTLKAIYLHKDILLYPSDEAGRSQYKLCHGDASYGLLAPREYWPRAVILSLILEKIENEIILLKEIDQNTGDLISKNIYPTEFINSWYRSKCYQQRFSAKSSDHNYAAAFDPQMPNVESLNYYKSYIQNHFFNYDTFGITHPLKSSGLVFRTSLGAADDHAEIHGVKKLHFGISSEISLHGQNVSCDRWEYDSSSRATGIPGISCPETYL